MKSGNGRSVAKGWPNEDSIKTNEPVLFVGMPFVEDWTTCPLKVATELELVAGLLRAEFKLSSFWKSARTSRAVCALLPHGHMVAHQSTNKGTNRLGRRGLELSRDPAPGDGRTRVRWDRTVGWPGMFWVKNQVHGRVLTEKVLLSRIAFHVTSRGGPAGPSGE